jgi:anti-anti-sigma regulatory factor
VKPLIAPITPSHNLTLPEGLDSVVAKTLAEALRSCGGEDVTIDASHVRWLGGHTLEVFRSAELMWRADGRQLTVTNAKANFVDDLKYFGVKPRYG